MDRRERRAAAGFLSRHTWVLVLLAMVVLAGVGVVRSSGADGPASQTERAHAIAQSLRCPTCQGLSVADSNSPLAQSMRAIIDERVAAGQGADEVNAYFVGRYGDWVLLSPASRGLGWLVWVLPAVVIVGGLLAASKLLGRRRLPQPVRWLVVAASLAGALAVLLSLNLNDRGAGQLPTGNLATQPNPVAPADKAPAARSPATAELASRMDALASTVAREPEAVQPRLALASTAFEAGRMDVVRQQAEEVLGRQPKNLDALLLRALAPSSANDPQARRALEAFRDLAPAGHPGLPVATALLKSQP